MWFLKRWRIIFYTIFCQILHKLIKSPSIWSSGGGMFNSSVCTCRTHKKQTSARHLNFKKNNWRKKPQKASGRMVVLNWLLARGRAQLITVMPDVYIFIRTNWEKTPKKYLAEWSRSMVSWLEVVLDWWLECQMLKFKEQQIEKKHQKSTWQSSCACLRPRLILWSFFISCRERTWQQSEKVWIWKFV